MTEVHASLAARNAMLNAFRDLIDAGGDGGMIRIYKGLQPASADATVPDSRLLGVIELMAPSGPDAIDGVLKLSAMTGAVVALASGEASFARISSSRGDSVIDLDVGSAAASVAIDNTSLVAGGPLRMASATISIPA